MPEFEARAFLPRSLSPMVRAYLECAEWCGIDEEDRESYEEADTVAWTNAALVQARQDCEAFLELIQGVVWEEAMSEERLGHDFWLTRNRHGVGFWDRGLGKLGETLTKWAHMFGEQSVRLVERGVITVRLDLV